MKKIHLRRAPRLETDCRKPRLSVPHHRRRAVLGRKRVLPVHARANRKRSRRPDHRTARDVHGPGRPCGAQRRTAGSPEHPGAVLRHDPHVLAGRSSASVRAHGLFLQRQRPGEAAGTQLRHADQPLRGGGVSVGLAGAMHRARHAAARMPTSSTASTPSCIRPSPNCSSSGRSTSPR